MHTVDTPFRPRTEADVIELASRYSLAWVISGDLPMLLPLRPIIVDNCLSGFRGHLPARLGRSLAGVSEALILVNGPSAYASPSWLTNRRQAPTWLSASGAFRCSIEISDSKQDLKESLVELVAAMEDGRDRSWHIDELGDRYEALAARIVAFRANIIDRRIAFRLAQDEDAQTFSEMAAGVERDGVTALSDMMRQFRGANAVP